MKITWYGQSCFKIQSKQELVVINPNSPVAAGFKKQSSKASILLLTNPKEVNLFENDEETFIIAEPGEYEVKGIFVYGIEFIHHEKKSIIYQIEVEGIKIGILDEINRVLNSDELEGLDGIDVLLIPVGGGGTVNAPQAREIINSVEPHLVIPSCYEIPGIKIAIDPVEKFLKEMGVKEVDKEKTLSLKKANLLAEGVKVVVLDPNS